jgi:hypothetical protein
MKSTTLFLLIVAVFATSEQGMAQPTKVSQPLSEQMFAEPDSTYYPGVYYYWCSYGKDSKTAITLDLEEMKAKKIQRVQEIDYGREVYADYEWLVIGSPQWNELIRHAALESKRLGLDFGVSTGAISAAGPWITPDEGAQRYVWADSTIEGGATIELQLPVPGGKDRYYKDIAILVMPVKEAVSLKEVVDVSSKVDTSGVLRWNAPAGRWKIMRTGFKPTYSVSTPNQGYFFSLDHLRKSVYQKFFNRFIGDLYHSMTKDERSAFKFIQADSYEGGAVSWTAAFRDEFKKRRGYDPAPYLPVLAGTIIDSKEVSARFKYDYRLTVSDLFVDFYRNARSVIHRDGLIATFQSSGPHQHYADALYCQKYSDIPIGEFWVPAKTHRTTLENQILLKEAVSAAHIYGKTCVSTETFTSIGPQWEESPWSMKGTADRGFCEGANQIYFHTYCQSPSLTAKPGYTYVAGTHFNRHITWWDYCYDWIAYLTRCHYMLRQGVPVVDVCFWYGEGYQRKIYRQETPRLGRQYQYDYTNSDVILTRMSARDGHIVMPDGMIYNVLVMPEAQSVSLDVFGFKAAGTEQPQNGVSVEVMKKLRELVKDGATIVGDKPTKSVGLRNYEANDKTVERIADDMWGVEGTSSGGVDRRFGKGRVVSGKSLSEVLASNSVLPDFEYKSSCRDSSDIDFIHRRTSNEDIYFVANLIEQTDTLSATFRVTGKTPQIWDAADGAIYSVPDYTDDGVRITIPLAFDPYGSMFVVFRSSTQIVSLQERLSVKQGKQTVSLQERLSVKPCRYLPSYKDNSSSLEITSPWQVTFDAKWGGPAETLIYDHLQLWNESPDARIKYYSGTAVYRNVFNLTGDVIANAVKQSELTSSVIANAAKQSRNNAIVLELGDLYNIAEVHINGKNLGTVWKKPYIKDITEAVKEGENIVEIKVTNVWFNRLAGDSMLPDDKQFTVTTKRIKEQFNKNRPLKPSGLLGPVKVRF